MFRRMLATIAIFLVGTNISAAQTLIKCGASSGHAYFFKDPMWNPDEATWQEDGISNGEIRLVLNGDEFDIEFGDVAGGSSYRSEGAEVISLASNDDYLTIGAFTGSYTEIYTFDLNNSIVAWSSHKVGTLFPKVATYVAECS